MNRDYLPIVSVDPNDSEAIEQIEPKKKISADKVLIIVLGILIAVAMVLLTVRSILSLAGEDPLNPPDPVENPQFYAIPRTPQTVSHDFIESSVHIGGERDDAAHASYAIGGLLYVFGQTTSRQYDMTSTKEGRNLYCAMSDVDGIMTRVVVFGTDGDDTICEVRPTADGFLVLASALSDPCAVTLYRVAYADCAVTEYRYEVMYPLSARDLTVNNGAVVVVCETVDAMFQRKSIVCFILNQEYGIYNYVTVSDQTCSYDYCAAYPSASGWTIFATVKENLSFYPAAISIRASESSVSPILRHSRNAKLLAVLPMPNGAWLLAAAQPDLDYSAMLIQIKSDFSVTQSRTVNMQSPSNAVMLTEGDSCIVSFSNERTESKTYRVKQTLEIAELTLPHSIGQIVSFDYGTDGVTLLSRSNTHAVVTTLSPAGNEQFLIEGMSDVVPVSLALDHRSVVVQTNTKGGLFPINPGGESVYVLRLNLSKHT